MTSQSASADTGAEAEPLEDKPFPLFELPVELVLRILRFAILGSSGRKTLRAVPRRRRSATDATPPPVTRTCRLLRREGLAIFYKECTFYCVGRVLDLHALCEWLKDIGPKHCSLISSIPVFLTSRKSKPSRVAKVGWGEVVKQVMTIADCARCLRLDTGRMCVLFAQGKLVLSAEKLVEAKEVSETMVCPDSFQISVREPTGSFKDGWTSCKDLLESYARFDDSRAMKARGIGWDSKDFWVRDGQ
ncbi:uncharacterized protein RHO25_003594 [Cercospora beticola]|uniref:F-box domain-containing protein n=1 Tax=Cercospora beticola TaxID=122368 RepID=A0ABZ0NHI0_CERBT|nr:hypothetical protein RHO25_003594 [Cercospora beticola]